MRCSIQTTGRIPGAIKRGLFGLSLLMQNNLLIVEQKKQA